MVSKIGLGGYAVVNVFKTKLDIKDVKPNFKPTYIQYDHARLEIELFDNGKAYDYSLVDRVEFTHLRSDGVVIIQSGEIATKGHKKVVRYDYQGTEMDLLGEIKTSLALFDANDKKVSSHAFTVVIVKDLREAIFEPASPNYGLLQKLLDDVKHIKEANSEEDVTNEKVIAALGYTPADHVHLHSTLEIQGLDDTLQNLDDILSSHFSDSNKKHIEIVDEIPSKLDGTGVFFIKKSSSDSSPNKTPLQNMEDQLNAHTGHIASTSQLGHVKIDGVTITIDSDGVISSVGGNLQLEDNYESESTETAPTSRAVKELFDALVATIMGIAGYVDEQLEEMSASDFMVNVGTEWMGAAAPYIQTITVDGILSSDSPIVFPIYSEDNATAISEQETWYQISKITTSDNNITLTCFEDKPIIPITLQLKVVR